MAQIHCTRVYSRSLLSLMPMSQSSGQQGAGGAPRHESPLGWVATTLGCVSLESSWVAKYGGKGRQSMDPYCLYSLLLVFCVGLSTARALVMPFACCELSGGGMATSQYLRTSTIPAKTPMPTREVLSQSPPHCQYFTFTPPRVMRGLSALLLAAAAATAVCQPAAPHVSVDLPPHAKPGSADGGAQSLSVPTSGEPRAFKHGHGCGHSHPATSADLNRQRRLASRVVQLYETPVGRVPTDFIPAHEAVRLGVGGPLRVQVRELELRQETLRALSTTGDAFLTAPPSLLRVPQPTWPMYTLCSARCPGTSAAQRPATPRASVDAT